MKSVCVNMKQAQQDRPAEYGCAGLWGFLCATAGYYLGKFLGQQALTPRDKAGAAGIAGGLAALCAKICYDLCISGVGKLAEVVGKWVCGHLKDTMLESCYDAFEFCRQRVHYAPRH